MRWTILTLCALAAGCSGLNTPTSPGGAARADSVAQDRSGLSGGGASDRELLLTGSFEQQTHSTFEPPITLVITGTGSGTATHLGRFTVTFEDRVNTTISAGTGTFNLVAANGDQLLSTTAGAETGFVPPNVSTVTTVATVTGGTGRFAGATGTFTIHLTQTIDFANSTATGSASFSGLISLAD